MGTEDTFSCLQKARPQLGVCECFGDVTGNLGACVRPSERFLGSW